MNKIVTTYAEKKAKQFLNLLQGYTKGIRMTAILILLLMGVSNAGATDFQGQGSNAGWISGDDDEGLILTWSKNSSTSTTKMKYKSLSSGGDLGSITTGLKLTKIEAKFWRVYQYGNICSATIFWELYKGDTKIANGSEDCTSWGSWSGNNCTLSETLNLDLLAKTTGPGAYTIKVYGKLTGRSQNYKYDDPSYLGCSDNFWYNNNNTGSYSITFTIDPVVTFKANGGTGSDYTQTVKYNTSTALTANKFTRTGYSFNGWKTAANSGTSYADEANVTFKANTTLYAQWTPAKYTITYKDQGGSNFSGTHTSGYPTQHTYGSATTLSTASKTGYTFEGWYKEAACTNKVTSLGATAYTANITLYAKWTANKYNVTLNPQSGTGGTTSVTATYGSAMPAITKPTRTGYTFNGYYDATSGGTQYYKADASSARTWNKTAATTLYAQWTPAKYTINYRDQNNANFSGSHATGYPTQHTYGTATTLKTATKTGYTFDGWHTDAACTNKVTSLGETAYTANITLYAKWTANKYTVTLSNQGATTAGTASVQATYGSAMPSATMPTKTGYTFGGYFTQTGGQGTQYYSGNGSSARTWNKTSATTLYAKWTETKYNIQININGNGTTNQTGTKSIGIVGISATATPAAGYIFKNWTVTGGAHVSDASSATTTITATAEGTVTANFEAVPTTIYLKPSANWKQANARFAIYAFRSGSVDKWVDMTPVGCNDEYYMADVPAGYSQFKFVRLNPATTENNWGNRWAETGNLTIPNNENNLFDMTQIYLEVNNWDVNDANERYAAYFYVKNGGDKVKWMSMSHVKDDIYKCDIPSEHNFDWVIFGRMDGNNSTNAFDNGSVWNQTSDLEITSNNYTHGNYFTITKFENGNTEGSWSWNDIAWTKLDLPTITITNNNHDYGTITVTTVGGTEITSGMEVDWDTEVIVSIQPNAGYAVESSSINIGGNAETIQSGKTYTICNNTTLLVSFEEKGEWYIAGIDDNWEVREEYKFIDDKILIELDGKETKEFKVVKKTGDDTEWYGNFTFKGLHPSGVLNTNSGDYSNCKVETVHDGDYLFIWNADENKLTIEYPDVIFLHGSFNGWKDKASHALHDRDAKVHLTSNTTYEFKVVEKGVYWTSKAYETIITNNGTKNIDDNAAYDTDPRHNCQIKATITGLYTFHFDKQTRVLTVTYPEDNSLKAGDYRLYYTETSKNHASDYVKKRATDGRDTVSLFINKDGSSPKVTLQKYDGSNWVDVNTEEVYNVSDINAIANDKHMYQGNGVWNFIITQVNGVAKVAINETHRYTGNYYIRTDAAGGGWNEYKIPENQMFFSSYARDNENFDHYFCKYIKSNTNVKFNVANDYSSQLCATDCDADALNNDNGSMKADGNVRFMYFSKTNTLGRAYLDGSSTDNFLRITDATNLYDADGKNSITTAKFTDLQNWIYQVDVQATKSTQIKLRAIYNGNEQYFKGSANPNKTVPLLASTSNDKHKIRLIYNFKTNHLVCAWLAAGETVDGTNQELGADMMLIRANQDPADQLYFNPNNNTLSKVKNAYAVMTFTEEFIKNEEKTIYERALYWVSFPYNVLISQVFGFGEYGEHWIMQYYDGAARAEKGLFSDSGTYWKYITNTNTILEKGKGYVLTLDLDKVKTSFIHGIESVSLYFPSDGELGTIYGDNPTSVVVPEHKCTIVMPDATTENRRDRTIYDSHWNMIGVPRFADISDFNTTPGYVNTEDLSFYYEYLARMNTYQVTANTTNFQAMYGYMVQFAGTLNWSEKTVSPAQLAARRNSESDEPEKISFRLEIAQDEVMADQTFVQLQQEGATAEFDMNLDLTKIINSGANIYTLAGEQRIQSAGNALPMGEAIVPVGVKIDAEGEYTFRMPDGTEGMVVELIDYESNTTTNLLLSDYTVTLPAGSNESRFALHIQPNKSGVTTGVENVGDEAKGIEKYLIDGKLIIRTAEGVIYDAQGHRL